MRIVPFEERLTSANALAIVRDFDVVADGTDNFPTRYLVNDACVLTGKPNVYASVFRFEGQASVFWAEKGPCYRCLYAEPPPPGPRAVLRRGGSARRSCRGCSASMQATETIKLLLGVGEPLIGRLVLVDALSMRFRELKIRKNPACVVCGPNPTVTRLIDYEAFCGERRGGLVSSSRHVRQTSRGHGRRAQGDARSRRRVRARGRARGARVGDLGPARLGQDPARDPAGEPREALARRTRSSSTAAPAGAAATPCSSCGGKGFEKAKNLVGGINRWAERIDPSLPRY